MSNEDDKDRGFYPKYRAFKIGDNVGGSMEGVPIKIAGVPVEEVLAPFFLLKFHDPHARVAIKAYADSCEKQYPKLAADLRRKLHNVREIKS
jgi:hypothetical protein